MRLFPLVLCAAFAACVRAGEGFYDQRYDYYDVDHFVQNPRLLKKYLDCFLDKGPCTPIGKVFKAVLPEVVRTACGKCSPSQGSFARRTFAAFQRHQPAEHAELWRKLDPRNEFHARFEAFLRGPGPGTM